MKFKEKIFVLHGFINDTIDKMTEGKTKRIQKNKSIPSGLFAFEIDGEDDIRTFGDLGKLHDVFVHRCKMDAKFQRFLFSVIADRLKQNLEEKLFNKPKFPSGGEMNKSKVIYDETTKIPKEFVMMKSSERKSVFEEKKEPTVQDYIEDIQKMKNERKDNSVQFSLSDSEAFKSWLLFFNQKK